MQLRLAAANEGPDVCSLLEQERRVFAAKLRISRAVLGWSQTILADRAGLTQRAVHKLEQGETNPRRSTVLSVELIWREYGIAFEDTADGFGLTVSSVAAVASKAPATARRVRFDLGVTSRGQRSSVARSA